MLHTHKDHIHGFLNRHITRPISMALALTLLLSGSQFFPEALMYQREQIANGEFWRILTGSLTHTNYWHLGMNLAGLWLLTSIAPAALSVTRILLLAVCVGLGLWLLNPGVVWYVGFSGALYGLFTFAGLYLLTRRDWLMAMVILIGICGKTLWDWSQGGAAITADLIEAPVIHAAHVYGMVGGVLSSLPLLWGHWRET